MELKYSWYVNNASNFPIFLFLSMRRDVVYIFGVEGAWTGAVAMMILPSSSNLLYFLAELCSLRYCSHSLVVVRHRYVCRWFRDSTAPEYQHSAFYVLDIDAFDIDAKKNRNGPAAAATATFSSCTSVVKHHKRRIG